MLNDMTISRKTETRHEKALNLFLVDAGAVIYVHIHESSTQMPTHNSKIIVNDSQMIAKKQKMSFAHICQSFSGI